MPPFSHLTYKLISLKLLVGTIDFHLDIGRDMSKDHTGEGRGSVFHSVSTSLQTLSSKLIGSYSALICVEYKKMPRVMNS